MNVPRIIIAATQSGAGKTTIVSGILAALKKRGVEVQAYKVGPDYIDTGFHELASGKPSHNLDSWLVGEKRLGEIFFYGSRRAEIALIEGVMGLYDGGLGGVSSTAQISQILAAPVILVIDVKSMGTSAAAIALGFREFDKNINLAGVILNRVGSDSHKKIILDALEKINIKCFGAIRRNAEFILPERHLGLVPTAENNFAEVLEKICATVENEIDIDAILEVAKTAPELNFEEKIPQICKVDAAKNSSALISELSTAEKIFPICKVDAAKNSPALSSEISTAEKNFPTCKVDAAKNSPALSSELPTAEKIFPSCKVDTTKNLSALISEIPTSEKNFPICKIGTAKTAPALNFEEKILPSCKVDTTKNLSALISEIPTAEKILSTCKIAVAKDAAFNFYYEESLHELEKLGAEIVYFSPLNDERLPANIGGLMIGGGFPEMFAEKLQANTKIRTAIQAAAENNLPIFAECGGFMYLMDSITDFGGKIFEMCGVIPARATMTDKLQIVGYVEAEILKDCIIGRAGEKLHAHEFHFSTAEIFDDKNIFDCRRVRTGKTFRAGFHDKNIVASYLHIHFAGCPSAAENFVNACKNFGNCSLSIFGN